jgi:hypothetical protein
VGANEVAGVALTTTLLLAGKTEVVPYVVGKVVDPYTPP